MEDVKTKRKVAEFEARKAEAKAKEVARAAEAEAKTAKAKAAEKEAELLSVLWKAYLDPKTKVQDKQLIREQIKRLIRSSE